MKKAKKSTAKPSRKRRPSVRKTSIVRKRAARKPARATRKKAIARRAVRARTKGIPKVSARLHARSAAKLAAGVISRRAARAETLAKSVPAERPPMKLEPRLSVPGQPRHGRGGPTRSGRSRGATSASGNRPIVRVSRTPQYNYMKAPGADSGFDVGDAVEVFCDHELEGERVRGWIKGVVVQVDNKLVAVQFRSNVFLTDGWMVPDRILWYSLGSDQIRGTGMSKKSARIAIPEY